MTRTTPIIFLTSSPQDCAETVVRIDMNIDVI